MSARFERLAAAMAALFAVEPGAITPDTTSDDVLKWDSIGHMRLVATLEKEFGVSFDVDEIMEMLSARRIDEFLEKKGVADGT